LVWDTITTTGWSAAGRAVGFFVPFFIAAWFGVSAETDAFFFAYGLILFFSGIFAPVIQSVVVPYIAEARSKGEDVGKFVGNLLGLSSIGVLAFMAVALLVIKPVLSLITRFDPQALDLVCWLLFETAPLVILLIWSSVFSGTLDAYGKFTFPAISPAFRAIVNIAIIYLFKNTFGVHAIALGYVTGEVIRLIILVYVIKRLKLLKLKMFFQLDSKLREFFKTASYRTIGMMAGSLNIIIDKTMASWLGEGSVSLLYYADRLYVIPISLMTAGLFPVILSHWSKDYYKKEDSSLLLQQVKNTAKVVSSIGVVVFLVLVICSRPLVSLAFARGEFDFKYFHILQWTFILYLCGLVPYVIGSICIMAHLTVKNTSFLMKLAIFNCFLNVVLNYVLMQSIGIMGIAVSTSISVLIIAILLFMSMHSFKTIDHKNTPVQSS